MELQQPYVMEVDRTRSFVRVTLRGLWTLHTVGEFAIALRGTLSCELRALPPGARLKVLVDLREHGVQSRDVTEAIQSEMTWESEAASRAVLVSPSALHRLQAQRVSSHLTASFFAEEQEAINWLLDGRQVSGTIKSPQV